VQRISVYGYYFFYRLPKSLQYYCVCWAKEDIDSAVRRHHPSSKRDCFRARSKGYQLGFLAAGRTGLNLSLALGILLFVANQLMTKTQKE
jgi:hypothetical protein